MGKKNELMIKGNENHEERERENRSHDLEKNKEKYVWDKKKLKERNW